MTGFLTTGDCARLLSQALDMEGAFDADFMRREIEDRRLMARQHHRAGRRRARIRIHPEDFIAYCRQHYVRYAGTVERLINVPRGTLSRITH